MKNLIRLALLCLCLLALRVAATTYYVDINSTNATPPYTNWSTASTDIQSAVNQTTNGDLVLVNPGVYQSGGETVNGYALTNRLVINDAITVQSAAGPFTTFVQGTSSLGTNAIRCVYMGNGASLIGFTVMNGSTLISGDETNEQSGGGILCASSNVLIINCIVATNSAEYSGGGIFGGFICNTLVNNNWCSPSGNGGGAEDTILTNCTLTANYAGNGAAVSGCLVLNSLLNNNGASYYGGAADLSSLCSCIITNNGAFNGGGACNSYLTNCLIIGNNVVEYGGGVCACTINNCTVVHNTAGNIYSGGDGGIDGSSVAYNSIIYYNGAVNGYANCDPSAILTYCCTTPLSAGTGNIDSIPLFVNATNDFHLVTNSACINIGNNSCVALSCDLDGNPRIIDGTVDMGAYEYQIPVPMTLAIQSNNTNVAAGFPLQFQAAIGQGFASYILWDFGDGKTVANQFSPSHIWPSPGTYTVTATISNSFVPETTTATLIINVVPFPFCYVNVNGTNPVPPYLSWNTAATNIQAAIDTSNPGDTIIVTDGVYQVGGEAANGTYLTNRVVINKSITVESVNGPANTIIEGYQLPVQTFYSGSPGNALPTSPNGSTAVRCVSMTTNATLIGFTLANGATLNQPYYASDGEGGGIWCASTNNDIVSNCVITANAAYYQGGGAFQGTFLNCTVLSNSAVAGGGVANATIFRSLVISNTATALPNYSYSGCGGGAFDCVLFSSAVADNYATSYGGGAYGGSVANCTITENSALDYSGGTAYCAATNSIIYYNNIFSSYSNYTNSDEFRLVYCDTTPNAGGANITAPPVLADISHISLNSPCRGAGTPLPMNGTDIDGNPWNNPPCIGCSEIPSNGDYGNLIVNISTAFTNWAPGFPLNFQATISGPDYTTIWNFGDGTTITNTPLLSHTWSSVGNYPVTLTAYNDSYPTGVTAALMINITVPTNYFVNWANPNPVPPYSYWSTAATDIQDAVNIATPGSMVLVTNPTVIIPVVDRPNITNSLAFYESGGTNGPDGNFYRAVITNAITVESVNGPATTYIFGIPPYGTANCAYLTNGATLNGFTFTNCSEEGPSAGQITAAPTNAVITNCIFAQYVTVYGGTLDNCSFSGLSSSVNSTLNDCVISNNSQALGGVLNNCVIINNSANDGIVVAQPGYPLTLNNCLISNNVVQSGGVVVNEFYANTIDYLTNCMLNSCTLTHNFGKSGASTAYYAEMNNCVITSNTSAFANPAVIGGLLLNCTLIGNSNGAAEDATLTNCSLVANFGLAASGCTLYQCTLLQNVGSLNGGGASGSVLNNCLIISNSATSTPGRPTAGGGTYYCQLTNCILADNIATNGGASYGGTLIDCIVTNNTAINGGGAYYCDLTNCAIAENVAANGGGAYESILINCTVTANSAFKGGGIFNSFSGFIAENCILYYNVGGDFYADSPQYPLSYCCVSIQPTNGPGNITNAPLFVNLAGGDFHLQSSSPCINSGNNAYISSATDLDGNPRIQGGTVDIGAYEYQTPTSVISYAYLQQYGLPTDGSVDFANLDRTTFNVYQDWIAGLNPTNPASILAMLTPVATNTATGVTVTWQSVTGIPYFLQRSTNLTSQPPFATIQNNIIGQSSITSYTDLTATNTVPYFYRVGVTAP